MKRITIKSITLDGFRGEKMRTTEFNPKETIISGANGVGKSRHFDAFVWLLFGKDTAGRKDYNIKTIVDGKPLERTRCSVSALLDVDGAEIELTRTYSEEWVKPRGSNTEVFKGNRTECYWNGVPISVGEYQKRVDGILDETLFKLLTNPLYFFSLPWQDGRELLTMIVPERTNEEIAQIDEEMADFIAKLSNKPIEDMKRELSARKKKLRKDLSEITPRIDQTRVMMPKERDWNALEKEYETANNKVKECEAKIESIAERINAEQTAFKGQANELNTLIKQRQLFLLKAQTEANKKANEANEARNKAVAQIETLKRTYNRLKDEARELYLEKATHNANADRNEKLVTKTREEWYEANAKEYAGETTCPHCKQPLPEQMIADAKALFLKHKKEELDAITTKGQAYKELVTHERTQADELGKKADAETEKVNELKQQIAEAEERLAQMPEAVSAGITPEEVFTEEELEEYKKLSDEIERKQQELETKSKEVITDSTDAYKAERSKLLEETTRILNELNEREQIKNGERQIAELEKAGQAISQTLAEAEHEELVIKRYMKVKLEDCAERINSLFNTLSFKLFTYTQEDTEKENPIETCEAMVCGVPFGVANTAGRIKAGIELINVLSYYYGITAPLFVDNRESINQLPETEAQIISLEVTDDKELTIK